jgi:hypothetical protein
LKRFGNLLGTLIQFVEPVDKERKAGRKILYHPIQDDFDLVDFDVIWRYAAI